MKRRNKSNYKMKTQYYVFPKTDCAKKRTHVLQ